jgi:hypothetical protein
MRPSELGWLLALVVAVAAVITIIVIAVPIACYVTAP